MKAQKCPDVASEFKEAVLVPVSSPASPRGNVCDIEAVRKKHDHHFSICVSRNGTARLQIHANPALTYKGETVQEVLSLALA